MLPQTHDEKLRLETLHRYGVLDTPSDDELDAIVRIAALVAGVPYATLNLIDENRQCQLTTFGFEGGVSSRDDSMCALYFTEGNVIVSNDASIDVRYETNPWVTGKLGSVRAYASAPLKTAEGPVLGSLCVFDTKPGSFTQDQMDRLADTANVVVALFERRRQARDLADREAALRYAVQDLERSNEDLQNFASVAGHDLASPLTTIGGYIELLGDMYTEQLDETAQSWIQISLDGVSRMHSLIKALLSYAQAGSAECHAEPTNLNDVLQGVLKDLRSEIEHSGAHIAVPSQLPTVHADATLMRQLLQNLIGNAIKYRDKTRDCCVEVSATRNDGGWEIQISDNGIGIPVKDSASVFDVFTRTNEDAAAGHGIGLATCRRIVERHHGAIWVDTERANGTTIHFTISNTTFASQ